MDFTIETDAPCEAGVGVVPVDSHHSTVAARSHPIGDLRCIDGGIVRMVILGCGYRGNGCVPGILHIVAAGILVSHATFSIAPLGEVTVGNYEIVGRITIDVDPPEVVGVGWCGLCETQGVATACNEVDVGHITGALPPETGVVKLDGVQGGIGRDRAVEADAPGEAGVGSVPVDSHHGTVAAAAYPVDDSFCIGGYIDGVLRLGTESQSGKE